MSDQTRDRVEGAVDKVVGRGKSAWGELATPRQNMLGLPHLR